MLRPARTCSPAFTLIELLVVMAIIAIMTTLMIPSVTGMMRAYQLDSTAQSVMNQLTLARQTAQTKGYAVQVRLYELPDYNQPVGGIPAVFRGMQSFVENAPGAAGTVTITPIARPYFFQSGIVMLNDAAKSTLLNMGATSPTATDPTLAAYGSNYKYIVFRFVPTGQTDLTENLTTTTVFCLTLVTENAALTSGLPANFATIQIDPINGALRSFRP